MPRKSKFVKPASCAGCKMETKGLGFVPDLVVPHIVGPRLAVWGRSPGMGDVQKGVAMSGQDGFVLDQWITPRAGITLPYSKCHTLRCVVPGDKYPDGKIRQAAETHCRKYDTLNPEHFDAILLTLSPSAVMHSKFDPLPLIIRDFERANRLLECGLDVLVLMGGEAMALWAPNLRHPKKGENRSITDWRGHYYPTGRYIHKIQQLVSQSGGDTSAWDAVIPHVKYLSDAPHESWMRPDRDLVIDLEWNPNNPLDMTRVGLCQGVEQMDTVSFPWDVQHKEFVQKCLDRSRVTVMHNGLGHMSDVDVLRRLGFSIDSDKLRDSMLAFHLLWPQFAGMGMLDLWSFTSLYTDAPNWKICRGVGHCYGPCPVHDPAGYNAMDARQTWLAWRAIQPELILRGMIA